MPSEPSTKGSVIRELLLWHDRRYGHAETAKLVEGLPPEAAARIDPTQPQLGILGASWYPMSVSHPMLTRVMERGGGEGRELADQASAEMVHRMIHGVYKVWFKAVASPDLYARHVGRLWKQLHSTGERAMVIRAPGEALSVIEGWPAHHPLACWLTIYTMQHVFEAMGYPRCSVERRTCLGHGAARCETLLRFGK